MRTDTLRINQISLGVYRDYLRYLQAMDDKKVEEYAEFLDDDCVMQMNNEPQMEGKAAIAAGLAAYWQSFESIEHELLNLYGTDLAFVLEALNHYIRLDGGKVTVRAVAFTDRTRESKVTSVRLYSDVSAVFAKK